MLWEQKKYQQRFKKKVHRSGEEPTVEASVFKRHKMPHYRETKPTHLPSSEGPDKGALIDETSFTVINDSDIEQVSRDKVVTCLLSNTDTPYMHNDVI